MRHERVFVPKEYSRDTHQNILQGQKLLLIRNETDIFSFEIWEIFLLFNANKWARLKILSINYLFRNNIYIYIYIYIYLYEVHTIGFQALFVCALLLIVHIWNSSPLPSYLLRMQCTYCTVPTTSRRPYGSPLVWACQWPSLQPLSSPQLSITTGLNYREAEELSWCPPWSNSLWQGWSCGLVYCPAGNPIDPIWRELASSDRISSWTPLKINIVTLTLTLWPINSNVLTSLFLPQLSSSLLSHLKTDVRFMQDCPKAVWSIPYVSVAFFFKFKTEFYCISFF